jgi:HAD superfamily hydrolase (TIGR01509 family)
MKRAQIFDLDGTLVKTQTEFHAQAEVHILQKYGITISAEAISARFAGIHTLEVFKELAPGINPHVLLKEKWDYMYQLALFQKIEPVEYAVELVAQLHAKGLRLGIASASPLRWIKLCLEKANIEKYFAVLASVDEVANGKPAPDVFLLAARRLNVKPNLCVAIDDGYAGAEAGVAAGMETYWLTQNEMVIPYTKKIKTLHELLN